VGVAGLLLALPPLGTMLHYEDTVLNDFYFVDPQWLCDMLAHIVTVRQINPFVVDGTQACTIIIASICHYLAGCNIVAVFLVRQFIK